MPLDVGLSPFLFKSVLILTKKFIFQIVYMNEIELYTLSLCLSYPHLYISLPSKTKMFSIY